MSNSIYACFDLRFDLTPSECLQSSSQGIEACHRFYVS